MSVHDLFSKRQKRLRGETPEVYVYDVIPEEMRVQVVHILRDTIGTNQRYRDSLSQAGEIYQFIVEALRREYGVFALSPDIMRGNYLEELTEFVVNEEDPERVLDAIELAFKLIDTAVRGESIYHKGPKDADAAISELNIRFKEHGIGYQFAGTQIIRVDSELIHAEVVIPALRLIHDSDFKGAENEFLSAHAHFRSGKYKESLVDSLKSLESTIKSICDKQGWKYDPKASCKDLIDICFVNELIPSFWTAHFSALRSTLESGVPTARNRMGGHGQGTTVSQVPDYLAAYTLHLTASAIVLLIEAEKHLP